MLQQTQETDHLTLRVIVRLENVGFTVECLKVGQKKKKKKTQNRKFG